ncbi:LacI family transcriptional regulator [Pseudonocardia sp. MH-G8]|nr:LacI family transcriptional regulator [Pseudonocardia sp. MH-G8]
MTDVAARAGVSLGTVSHVLNHPERVKESTRRRVHAAIDALGFVRNSQARSLAAGENRTIGLVLVDLGNTLFVDIARGAQQEATARGMTLLLANSDNDDDLQDVHLDFFEGARVSGILLAPMTDPRTGVDRVRRRGTPVVVLNYDSGRPDCCTVLVDNEQAGHLAARHMLDLGHRRLAFVAGRDHLQPVRDRRRGVRRAVTDAGAELVEIPTEDLSAGGGPGAAARLAALPAHRRPDAVIAVTDLLGMGLVQELGRAGLAVPGDIAVMGCDYDKRAWGGAVPLTSVRMPGEEIGVAAVGLLVDEVARGGEHRHETVVVQPSLVVRESSAGREHDPLVAARSPAEPRRRG